MADDYPEDETPPPAAAQSPALQEFQEAFTSPAAKDWAGEVSARLNDYFTRRQIADDNTMAGNNFVADMDTFKSGLVNMVQADPNAVHTALDIVPPTISALMTSMPNPPENADDHHASLTGHIQGEIATAAVTRLAETHEGAARGMLNDERIKAALGDAAGPLDTYISAQAQARQTDHEAEVADMQAHAALAADQTAVRYLSALYDPASGTTQFPPGWNQAVLKDPAIPPPIKNAMAGVYDRLRGRGDVETSDPSVITDAIRRAANGLPPPAGELLSRAGQDLTLNDALTLTRKLSISPAAKVEAEKMMETIDAVGHQIASPEYGIAGARAYGRFVNWFVGEYARQGPSSLNPQSDRWMLNPEAVDNPIDRFRPTGGDLINVEPLANFADKVDMSIAKRPTLDSIFNRGGRAREPAPHAAPAGYQYDASGSIVPVPVPSHPNTAPFYGVEPVPNDQAVNPAGIDRDAAGHPLTEMRTDAGIKALTPTDIARSTSGPRPVAAPALSEDEQRTFQETGKLPTRGAAPTTRGTPVRSSQTTPVRSAPRRRR
jgi:hypothetical protein